MAKSKFELDEILVGELTGFLDYGEEGNRVVFVDNVEHDLDEFIDQVMGGEIQIKASKRIKKEEDDDCDKEEEEEE